MALIAQAATLDSRVPFLHFFDGFRTSHELNTLDLLSDAQIRAMIDDDLVRAHRARALDPEHPFMRGTAQNPDTFFQAREAVNPFYADVPDIVQAAMDRLAALTGRPTVCSTMTVRPMPSGSSSLMGSGRKRRARPRPPCARRAKRSACCRCACSAPSRPTRFLAALAADHARDRRAGTDQGAWCHRRAAVPGRRDRARRGRRDQRAGDDAACDRRALRPVVEGFHSGRWRRPYSTSSQPRRRRHGFTVGITDDVGHTSLAVDPASRSSPTTKCGRCSTASAPTARSARTRTV